MKIKDGPRYLVVVSPEIAIELLNLDELGTLVRQYILLDTSQMPYWTWICVINLFEFRMCRSCGSASDQFKMLTAPGQLYPAQPRPIWPSRCDLFCRRRRSRRMARAQWSCSGLASVLERQTRRGSARRRAPRSRYLEGSYVEPRLYRACIRASGKPSRCSDDASAHP